MQQFAHSDMIVQSSDCKKLSVVFCKALMQKLRFSPPNKRRWIYIWLYFWDFHTRNMMYDLIHHVPGVLQQWETLSGSLNQVCSCFSLFLWTTTLYITRRRTELMFVWTAPLTLHTAAQWPQDVCDLCAVVTPTHFSLVADLNSTFAFLRLLCWNLTGSWFMTIKTWIKKKVTLLFSVFIGW